jgi:hypothetical protein
MLQLMFLIDVQHARVVRDDLVVERPPALDIMNSPAPVAAGSAHAAAAFTDRRRI